MAYAELEQLELRLGEEIAPGLRPSVELNLSDASAYIDAILAEYAKNPCSVPEVNLQIVCCNLTASWMAKQNSIVPDGAQSISTSVGDFSQSVTYGSGNYTNSFNLSASDKLLLGLKAKAGSIYMGCYRG